MAVVTKTVLKSYFNDGDVPNESNYIDLIDTMGDGDMLKSVYDTTNNGVVNDSDKLDGLHYDAFHLTGDDIINVNDIRIGGGLSVGNTLYNAWTGQGYFRNSEVSGTYGVHGSMDNLVIEQNAAVGITFIVPTGNSAYIARIDRTESDLWRQGIRFNDVNGVDIYANNAYVFHAYADRVYIATDLRVLSGLYVGADVDPTDNNIIAVGDIKAGSGLVVGSTTATPATGEIRFYDSSCKIFRQDAVGYQINVTTPFGYVLIGPRNTGHMHFETDRVDFWFSKTVASNGDGKFAGGVYAGSYITDAPTGCFIGTADVRVSGGVGAGNRTADVANGCFVGTGDVRVAGGGSFGSNTVNPAAGDVLMSGGLTVGSTTDMASAGQISMGATLHLKAGSSNSYALIAFKDSAHGHLYVQDITQNAYLFLNWYGGNSTYNTANVRIGDRNSAYGDIQADNFVNESTIRVKTNIESVSDSLSVIDQLTPVWYTKKRKLDKRRVGLIAEDVYGILPEVVSVDEEGLPDGIDYGQLVPILIGAIQELKEEIRMLQ